MGGIVLKSFDTGWRNVDEWTRAADERPLLVWARTIRIILSGQQQGGRDNDA